MTAKQFLSRRLNVDRRIDAMLEEACRLRDKAQRISAGDASATRVVGGRSKSPLEDAVTALADLEGEVLKEVQRLVRIKREIDSVVKQLPDERHQVVLARRYIMGQTWEDICERINCSLRTAHNIHTGAITEVERILRG